MKATLFAAAWIVVSSRVLAEASPTITPEWQYRHAAQLCNEALVKNFDGRQDERIYVVPVNPVFDTATAFSQKPSNALHPTEEGFVTVDFQLTAWMTHLLEIKAVTTKQ